MAYLFLRFIYRQLHSYSMIALSVRTAVGLWGLKAAFHDTDILARILADLAWM